METGDTVADGPQQSVLKARIPEFATTCQLQNPAPGPFSVEDIEWKQVLERGKAFMVAAILKDRLPDFLSGEGARGDTVINTANKSDSRSAGVATDLACECNMAATGAMQGS